MTDEFSVRPRKFLTREERKARRAVRRADAAQAMLEYEATVKTFHQNRERLKADSAGGRFCAGREIRPFAASREGLAMRKTFLFGRRSHRCRVDAPQRLGV
jgi:hypothetical protein